MAARSPCNRRECCRGWGGAPGPRQETWAGALAQVRPEARARADAGGVACGGHCGRCWCAQEICPARQVVRPVRRSRGLARLSFHGPWPGPGSVALWWPGGWLSVVGAAGGGSAECPPAAGSGLRGLARYGWLGRWRGPLPGWSCSGHRRRPRPGPDQPGEGKGRRVAPARDSRVPGEGCAAGRRTL